MQRCCTNFMAALDLKSAAVKTCPMHCDVMLCPVCLNHRSRTTLKKIKYCLAETVRPATEDAPGDYVRHVVLTTPRWVGDVREAAEMCARWFSNLKRSGAWKAKVRASMGVFECTGDAVRGWGWHVHCLTIGDWWQSQCKVTDVSDDRPGTFIGPLPKLSDYGKTFTRPARPSHGECECVRRVGPHGRRNAPTERCLMQQWHQTTDGEAFIVHISAAGEHHRGGKLVKPDHAQAINEAIKYVVKTVDLSPHALVDFTIGMSKFTRVRWGGEWYGAHMNPPDDAPHEPRVMVCPDDLWRFSTGTIGELWGRLTSDSEFVLAGAVAAGWTLVPFVGPIREGRARPPPEVELPKEFAVTAVENLEEASEKTERTTELYLSDNPDQRAGFTVGHLPF